MFALYLLKGKSWKLHEIVKTDEEAEFFQRIARDMMNGRPLGVPINGYDVHELRNQADEDQATT